MNDVIHAASDINLNDYTYNQVYASSDATPIINGVEVFMVAGSSISIQVKSISETANIFIMGSKKTTSTVING